MKLDQLRKIIREEVRAAVKEELQDVITEAVKIASTPEPKLQKANAYVKVSESMPKKWSTPIGKQGSLETMLEQTGRRLGRPEAAVAHARCNFGRRDACSRRDDPRVPRPAPTAL